MSSSENEPSKDIFHPLRCPPDMIYPDPMVVYGRPSTCTELLSLHPGGPEVQVYYPIRRSDLPHDFTFLAAKLLYQGLKTRHDGDVKSWTQQSGENDFVERFELRQNSLSALQIWMWTHAHSSSDKKSWDGVRREFASGDRPTEDVETGIAEGADVVTTRPAANESHIVDHDPSRSRRQEHVEGTGMSPSSSPQRTSLAFASCFPRSDAEEEWERQVVDGQIPYQPGEGEQSPTRSEMDAA
nr:hypothetical protein CFP56_29875 [Quercus suber]